MHLPVPHNIIFISCLLCIVAGGIEEGVRIVGTGECDIAEGRVEVYDTANAVWGTVCDDRWSTNDARVVCAQLGYTGSNVGRPYYEAYFGRGIGRILLTQLACLGTEDDLRNCSSGIDYALSKCRHYEDAGVSCEEPGYPEGLYTSRLIL